MLCREVKEEQTTSFGLVIAEGKNKKPPQTLEVLAVGPEVLEDEVKVGDRVLVVLGAGDKYEEDLRIVELSDVLGVLEL